VALGGEHFAALHSGLTDETNDVDNGTNYVDNGTNYVDDETNDVDDEPTTIRNRPTRLTMELTWKSGHLWPRKPWRFINEL
jgi:hypothetical protein